MSYYYFWDSHETHDIIKKGPWISTFDTHSPYSKLCIVQTPARPTRSYAESFCTSIEPIRSYLTSLGSSCDIEMCWLLDVKILTNPMDKFTLSWKINSSGLSRVGQAEPNLLFMGSDNVGQDRTWKRQNRVRQDRAGNGKDRLLSLILVPLTCFQITLDSQHCLFVQLVSVLFFWLK